MFNLSNYTLDERKYKNKIRKNAVKHDIYQVRRPVHDKRLDVDYNLSAAAVDSV